MSHFYAADHAPIDGDKVYSLLLNRYSVQIIDCASVKDPLDVCVLTEKSIPHGDFLLKVASCEQTTATHFIFSISVLLQPRSLPRPNSRLQVPPSRRFPHDRHGGGGRQNRGGVEGRQRVRLNTPLQNKQNITLLLSCIQTTTPASSCCRSYGHITTLSELPSGVVDRLRHYFLTCAPPLHT